MRTIFNVPVWLSAAGAILLLGHLQVWAQDVDDSPLPVTMEPAFPALSWTGRTSSEKNGRYQDFRPIVLTHAGDGTNRIFVATQRGVIHVFDNSPSPQASRIFLDMRSSVRYDARENEEGLLGLAFHPDFQKNGEFFIHYTTSASPHTSIVARRRVRPNNPDQAEDDFEEVLFRIEQPYWNHNGGGLLFGPDGYLYLSLGDGGAAGDPHGNGQNTQTLFGTICRVDVDHQADGRHYAIPDDNPFAASGHSGRPEIFAYGLRNVWGMAFDRNTGLFWAADVGQDRWEEINLIVAGGNYGWNRREGRHAFPPSAGADAPHDSWIEPIWEYDHEVGKSITGGSVYRGTSVPALSGAYVYADFVSGKVWALAYDPKSRRVTANRPLRTPQVPIVAFGTDAQDEMYVLGLSADGNGIYRFRME